MDTLQHLVILSDLHNNIIKQAHNKGYRLLTRVYHPDASLNPLQLVNAIAPKLDYILSVTGELTLQVLNEPNHAAGYEGDYTAQSFADFSLDFAHWAKMRWPNAYLIYAPMALPGKNGNIWEYYKAGLEVMHEAYDGVAIHPYWQNFLPGHQNHKAREWGECYKILHEEYTKTMPIYVTEFGNSNGQGGHPINYDVIASEYQQWIKEAYHKDSPWHKVIHSFASFIAWSPWGWGDFHWFNAYERRPMCDLLRKG